MLVRPNLVTDQLENFEPAGSLGGTPEPVDRTVNTEAALIGECRRGRQEAWDALFDKYYPTVARFVFQLSAEFNHEDTEEICQEAFLAVVRNLNSFQAKSSFQTWLLRIASNKAMDFRQKLQATKRGGKITVHSDRERKPCAARHPCADLSRHAERE